LTRHTTDPLKAVTLNNKNGATATFLNFGARLVSIKVPANGGLKEMLVGYKKHEDYLADPYFLGAICGRVCNRISGATFSLKGFDYKLDVNDGLHCLHGGRGGFSQQFWIIEHQSESKVVFSLLSPHLDQGFPGELSIKVSYDLQDNDALAVEISASTSSLTAVNITFHPYFNLGEPTNKNLQLTLNSASFLARDNHGIPTGRGVVTSELGVDLAQPTKVSDFYQNSCYPQINDEQGLDHCFLLKKNNRKKPDATLGSDLTGVTLAIYSNQIAMQVYTGHFLTSPLRSYAGICLEPQGYTDAVNRPRFPSILIDSDQIYRHTSLLEFSS
jgi:aldose 1-epimerase